MAALPGNRALSEQSRLIETSDREVYERLEAMKKTTRNGRLLHAPPNPKSKSWQPPYFPIHLQKAYGARDTVPQPLTIAVVSPYAHPKAQEDLATYRETFGLPPTTIVQLNQRGGDISEVSYSPPWGLLEMLDLDMVSAASSFSICSSLSCLA